MQRRDVSEIGAAGEESALRQMREETGLMKFWLVVARRKSIFLAVWLTAITSAAALSFVLRPVYEGRVVVEIGKVGGSLVVEEASAVVRWLKEEYGVDDPDRRGALPRLDSIEHSPKSGQNILVLRVRDLSTDGAQEFLNGVASRLAERHQKLYDEASSAQQTRLRDLGVEIVALQNQVNLLEKLTKDLDDRGQAAVVAVERGGLLGALAKLRDQRASLELSLSAMQSYPTRLVGKPAVSNDPVRPRPALYLSLGVVLGLLLGVFAAFVAEFLANARGGKALRASAF
jgi:uncharacterized protein involved in exopolysaccharide biosynthesis